MEQIRERWMHENILINIKIWKQQNNKPFITQMAHLQETEPLGNNLYILQHWIFSCFTRNSSLLSRSAINLCAFCETSSEAMCVPLNLYCFALVLMERFGKLYSPQPHLFRAHKATISLPRLCSYQPQYLFYISESLDVCSQEYHQLVGFTRWLLFYCEDYVHLPGIAASRRGKWSMRSEVG